MSINAALVQTVLSQWDWFGCDLTNADKYIDAAGNTTLASATGGVANRLKERVEPFAGRIADYWLAIPSAEYNKLVRQFAPATGRLDGTTRLAWSAAFISYCMQMAGAGMAFPYSASHVAWINRAIRNRQQGRNGAGLVGYRPGEVSLAVGDLIAKPRTAGITYDNSVATGWYESHSDIVVDIDLAARVAHIVGGNVGQSVSKVAVTIDAAGRLTDNNGWIVVIKNQIALPVGVQPAVFNPLVDRAG